MSSFDIFLIVNSWRKFITMEGESNTHPLKLIDEIHSTMTGMIKKISDTWEKIEEAEVKNDIEAQAPVYGQQEDGSYMTPYRSIFIGPNTPISRLIGASLDGAKQIILMDSDAASVLNSYELDYTAPNLVVYIPSPSVTDVAAVDNFFKKHKFERLIVCDENCPQDKNDTGAAEVECHPVSAHNFARSSVYNYGPITILKHLYSDDTRKLSEHLSSLSQDALTSTLKRLTGFMAADAIDDLLEAAGVVDK